MSKTSLPIPAIKTHIAKPWGGEDPVELRIDGSFIDFWNVLPGAKGATIEIAKALRQAGIRFDWGHERMFMHVLCERALPNDAVRPTTAPLASFRIAFGESRTPLMLDIRKGWLGFRCVHDDDPRVAAGSAALLGALDDIISTQHIGIAPGFSNAASALAGCFDTLWFAPSP